MRSPPQVPDGNSGNGVRLAACGSTVGRLLISAVCTACSMRWPLSSGKNSSQLLPCTRLADKPLWLAIHWFHNTTRWPASSTTRPRLASPRTRPYRCWPAVMVVPRTDGRRNGRRGFFACGLSNGDERAGGGRRSRQDYTHRGGGVTSNLARPIWTDTGPTRMPPPGRHARLRHGGHGAVRRRHRGGRIVLCCFH